MSNPKSVQKDAVFDSKDYKRTREAFIAECLFENFIAIIVADAFLASLLNRLGFSDSMIGLISTICSLALLFELCAIVLAKRITNVKRTSIISHLFSSVFFAFLYLTPFLNLPQKLRPLVTIFTISVAYAARYLVNSIKLRWATMYIAPTKRARFGALNENVSLIAGIIFSLVMGFAIDKFKAADNLEGAFLFTAIAIAVLGLFDLTCFALMRNQCEAMPETASEHIGAKEGLKAIFSSKKYCYFLFAYILYNIAVYFTAGFLGIYKTKELALSFTQIQLIIFIGIAARMIFSAPIAKYSDKRSYASGIIFGLTLTTLSYAALVFTTPTLWWMIVVHSILWYVASVGTGSNFYNIIFDCVEERYFVFASVVKFALSGIFGFASAIVAGKLVDYIQVNGNTFLGIEAYAQQVLAAISGLICLFVTVFIKLFLEKNMRKGD